MSGMKIDIIHKLLRIIFIIFLALVCGGQVYQSVHLHHFHTSDSVAFEVSAHPLSVANTHTSRHHHHEEESSHKDDGEHKHKKTAWRKAPRSKSFAHVTFDSISQPVYAKDLSDIDFEETRPFSPTSPQPKECYISFGAIRGPPLLA